MLTEPLHHCYLIAANSVVSCVPHLQNQLQDTVLQANDFALDVDITETFTIEMARDLRERGQQKATGQKQCFIRGFDIATTEAQNALLKIIEDPAVGVHFFLVTPQPDQLLETIRSRTHLLDDVCSEEADSTAPDEITEEFIKATSLPDRLAAVGKLQTKQELRIFVQHLAKSEMAHKHQRFGRALEQVTDWGKDSGASVKLLGQYLATELSRSPKGK